MIEQKTILLVEDNDKNRKLFRDLLVTKNCHVHEAENGKHGVELARRLQPDLIVIDWHMPVMNGLDAIKLLKSSPETQNIPVLCVTASAMENEIQDVEQSGCNDYLSKPIDINEFLVKVERLLTLPIPNSAFE